MAHSDQTIEQMTAEVHEYFQDNDIDTTDSALDLESLAAFHNLTPYQLCVLLCNLEDTDTMQEIVDGDPYQFDPWNESQFNDGYYDVIDTIGLEDDEHEGDYSDNEDED